MMLMLNISFRIRTERKFDWNNLFLSCAHCNAVKNKHKYDGGIIDCCKTDPESVLNFKLQGNEVTVDVIDGSDPKTKLTAELVEEVFHTTNTGILTLGSEARLYGLQREMNVLYSMLQRYVKNPDNVLVIRTLRGLLNRESAYAGFKRCYIRSHREEYPDLQAMVNE